MPKFAIGENVVQLGGESVRVVGFCGVPFDEPCYWVSDGLSRWVCSESLLTREVA